MLGVATGIAEAPCRPRAPRRFRKEPRADSVGNGFRVPNSKRSSPGRPQGRNPSTKPRSQSCAAAIRQGIAWEPTARNKVPRKARVPDSGEAGAMPQPPTDGQRRLPPSGVQPGRPPPCASLAVGSSSPDRGLLRAFRSNASERQRRPKLDIGRGLSRARRHARGRLPRSPSPRACGTANKGRSLGAEPGHAGEESPPHIAFGHGGPRAPLRLLGACQKAAFGAPAPHSPERGLGVRAQPA